MAGKVFISCGQRECERPVARDISKLLEDEFGLSPYLAFSIQSVQDIMTITNELRSSDYYLFIDFVRRAEHVEDLPVSLFTHQELAVAHTVGFVGIIALQQNGAPQEGFLKYVLSNPERFSDEADLITKVRRLVKERGWAPTYSRNLVVNDLTPTGPWEYTDHTGTNVEMVWQVTVENRRPDTAAERTVCILDKVERVGGPATEGTAPSDRAYLKWARQIGYERTILPADFGVVDIFSVHAQEQGLFLHSMRDTPREPIVMDDGDYDLVYKLFSSGFPLVQFRVRANLDSRVADWTSRVTARLLPND